MSATKNVVDEKPPAVQISLTEEMTIQPRNNDEKVAYLIKQTGMEQGIAKEFLESNGWDLEGALEGYKDALELEKKNEGSDQKNLSTYDFEKRKVSRGFSLSNFHLIQDEREKQKTVVTQANHPDSDSFKALGPSARETFVLPDISMLAKDVAQIIKTELISKSALVLLSNAGRLNWWSEIGACRKLFPLLTNGDGNCLLHAVSLGMWGFHDRMLILRKALHQMLQNPLSKKALKRRWKYDLWMENMKYGGLTYNHDQWEHEWESVVKLASNVPHKIERTESKYKRISRQHSLNSHNPELEEGESLDSLEAIHVYALANLLCRPIIVISEDMLKDADGNDIAEIPFGGIYLPFEQDIKICYKYPLILAYESSHFSALVPADGDKTFNGERLSTSIPLQTKALKFLPIKFETDPGTTWDMVQDDSLKEEKERLTFQDKIHVLRTYLDVVKVPTKPCSPNNDKIERDFRVGSVIDHVAEIFSSKHETRFQQSEQPMMIIAAKLNLKHRPKHYKEMIDNFIDTKLVEAQELREKQMVKCTTCCQPALQIENGMCQWCNERASIFKGKGMFTLPFTKGKEPKQNTIGTLVQNTNNMTISSENCTRRSKTPSPKLTRPSAEIHNEQPRPLRLPPPGLNKPPGLTMQNSPTLPSPSPLFEQSATRISAIQPAVEMDGLGKRSFSLNERPYPVESEDSTINRVHSEEDFRKARLCRVSGCNFYGSNETLGFCSSCYRQYNQGMLKKL